MKETKALKTPEEMAAYFKAMPKKKQENPYWGIDPGTIAQILDKGTEQPICFDASSPLFRAVRNFFRRYYESFGSEAQVLFVEPSDAASLSRLGIPVLTEGFLGTWLAAAVVLPQDNHMGTSVISEAFWQERIVNAGIKPIARMHSHHVLSPYQSATDYASLNSGTLELVMGHIDAEPFYLCYWLDVPGTDQKRYTFLADNRNGTFTYRPAVTGGWNRDRLQLL